MTIKIKSRNYYFRFDDYTQAWSHQITKKLFRSGNLERMILFDYREKNHGRDIYCHYVKKVYKNGKFFRCTKE